jgi:hypothetical protein
MMLPFTDRALHCLQFSFDKHTAATGRATRVFSNEIITRLAYTHSFFSFFFRDY